MRVWLLHYDKFVKVNDLAQVTNPTMFDMGNIPTKDGLFSTEIFGVSTKQRKETFAYIDLMDKYLVPKVYILLKRLNRNFEHVVYGSKKFSIVNGELVPDEEKGGTGLRWLYKNWESISFKKNYSRQRNERIDILINTKKDVLFTDKFCIIPAFYRDVNLQGSDDNPRIPEINDLYSKIIRNVKSVQDANNLDFITLSLSGKVQDLMVDVYNLLKEKIEGKSGYFRKFLMGKSVDYGSRVVITATPYNTNREDEQDVNFYYTGVPLSHVCSELTPFIIFWLKQWFKNNVENQKNGYMCQTKDGTMVPVKLDHPESYFNDDYIEKHLYRFIKNPYTRFDIIELPIAEEELKKKNVKNAAITLEGIRFDSNDLSSIPEKPTDSDMKKGTKVRRFMTWTDLLYMAAVDVSSDKHIWITRYPTLDYFGTYVTRITVISTRKTVPMMVNGRIYKKYPDIDLTATNRDMDAIFRDTFNLCALYLAAIGGDHDGDQVTGKCVFSMEANEEAEKIMISKTNLLTIEGTGIRGIGNEGIQTLFSMTTFH